MRDRLQPICLRHVGELDRPCHSILHAAGGVADGILPQAQDRGHGLGGEVGNGRVDG